MTATGDTPLSDLIAAYVANGSSQSWTRFLEEFRKSLVGVVVVGLPKDATGDIVTTAERPLSVGLTRHAGGRSMVLAFADPVAFHIRFGCRFNATLTGESLLAMARLNPDCAGILINSALAEVSIPIDRITIEGLLAQMSDGSLADRP